MAVDALTVGRRGDVFKVGIDSLAEAVDAGGIAERSISHSGAPGD